MKRNTPKSLQTYSAFILVITVADLVNGVSVLWKSIRLSPTDDTIFVMFHGACELYSKDLLRRAEFWYAVSIQAVILNHFVLIASYIYRLLVITKPFDQFDRKVVSIIVYTYSAVHFCYFMWVLVKALRPFEEINEAVAAYRPELIGSNWTYYAVLDLNSPSQIVMNILSIYLPWIVLLVALICRWRISHYLSSFQFSANMKQLQKSVVYVLYAQTLGPALTAMTAVFYIIVRGWGAFNIYLFENLMMTPVSLMVLVNPIVTIGFVVPYRAAFLKLFNFNNYSNNLRLVAVEKLPRIGILPILPIIMSALPQLYYFPIRGFAEYIRLLFVDNGVKFEDHRVPKDDVEWPKLKKTMIFGQVPCLRINGKELVQTGTIMRYLGKVYDLNGANDDEAAFIDMFFEGVRDVRIKYIRYIYHNEETREQFVNVTLPAALEKLEALFKVHPGDFVIGNKISYADYILFEELDVYNTLDDSILNKFPVLKAFRERIWNRKNLKTYLEKRVADKVWINAIDRQ
ncbi:unnamed protein product [Caenorhabditis sp. 36 PRJEB53466]|nr:unnamed protein product [Caenorhabditis sp. 36 PRJEB53466]